MTEKKIHWTQTETGRKKISDAMKIMHQKKKEVKANNRPKKYAPRVQKKDVASLVINGWRISLGKDVITIERE